ncbi:MBOAT family O-acyltransferase [Nitrosovibrio sp. Nv4]|uniref:MBOAT family O-acyltransferase n=1 Tax=Nitrosovibrio sp. Nv4 TaxID=1945880 RepID=UPI000BCC9355|nr:MBOAT family protein [Nitrosovibrio sp. Nv4]SOD41826.1 D-alanyl-lipoteichoic acid acyltransferase DltB, MBOAT superfamily [Nitrosovibrio sp. Nv4]
MIFSSPKFILLFLPLAFFGYFFLNRLRLVLAGKAWLVAVSLFFYAYWNIAYLPLLLGSIFFNFAVGTSLSRNPASSRPWFSPRFVLGAGIVANLGLLGYFKYADFLIENINTAFDVGLNLPQILLPLGISFFTFTQIAYLVDSYRGEAKEYDFLNYALFVTFFPHLIAGPILHHREMMSQFASRWTLAVRYRNIALGLFIFSIGLFKKVVIADTFAVWADAGFDGGKTLDFFSAWATSLSYTFQLYFDFSGYCDMAIGAALLFNIWLPINFNSPYQALDIQDFWRRWHMTLSRYLRDYLYIPLGGSRCSTPRVYFNLMATFILGGLWHGASWMFVIWGALHGAALVVHRAWSGLGLSMPKAAAWLLTFNFINITWIFFRANTPDDALRVIRGMADIDSVLNFPVIDIPANSLVWGGWFSDYLLRWLPAGLAANVLCFGAIMLTLGIISQKNSFELMVDGHGAVKLSGALLLFCIAMHFTMATTSSVFLYFNF